MIGDLKNLFTYKDYDAFTSKIVKLVFLWILTHVIRCWRISIFYPKSHYVPSICRSSTPFIWYPRLPWFHFWFLKRELKQHINIRINTLSHTIPTRFGVWYWIFIIEMGSPAEALQTQRARSTPSHLFWLLLQMDFIINTIEILYH